MQNTKQDYTGRELLNNEQYEVVARVAGRIIYQLKAANRHYYTRIGEPLRWSMRGGPGTGKTRIRVTLIKLLNS